MVTSIHYLENDDGLMLAQAFSKAQLPKIKNAKHVEVKLQPHQLLMLEDGFPPALLLTASQRAAAWRANPPRAFKDTVSEARKKEEELAKLRETMPGEPVMGQLKKKAKPAPIDVTGKRWNTARSRWEDDPFYNPAEAKKKPTPAAEPAIAEFTTDAFQTKFGSYLEIGIRLAAKANPRKAGTKAYAKWESLVKFLKKNPKATVAEIFASTSYQKNDLIWDVERKSVTVFQQGTK